MILTNDNTTGQRISFVGNYGGPSNTTGERNTFLGYYAGYGNQDGSHNAIVGTYAVRNSESGEKNVFLGYHAGYFETGSNKLYIANSTDSTPLIWGDFAENKVVIYGGFRSIASYSSSDGRCKKNIEPLESSLDKISNLQGVIYEWKTDEYPHLGLTKGKQIGLAAQDVEKEISELVSENKDGYKAVSYTKLTAVLVEAVKELKILSEKQQTEIKRFRVLVRDLKS